MERFDSSFFDTIHDRRGTGSIKYGTPPAGAPEDVIPMWVADMDFPTPPAVAEAMERAARQKIFGYTMPDESYSRLLADWYGRRMGWQIDTAWLAPIPSVLAGVSAAIRALTAPGEGVLLCQPVYYPFARIITGCGRELMVSPLRLENGRYRFDFADLEKKLQDKRCKVFLLCSPHNPVGRVWTREELAELGDLCCKYDVKIISDEIHADLVFTPNRHVPMASVSPEIAARTVTCMAPTKTFNMAGLPAAHMIIPNEELRRGVAQVCSASGQGLWGVMPLAAATAAYGRGEPWLDGLLAYLKGNLALLHESFPAGAPITALETEGTYLAWLDCRGLGLNGEELDDFFLKKAGIWLDGGTMFGAGGEGFQRLNFACPRSVLQKAIDRIKKAAGMA